MAARDDYPNLPTLTLPPPSPVPPTRFERITGERIDVEDGPGASPTADDDIDFAVDAVMERPRRSAPRTAPVPTDVATLALDLARVITSRLPHTRQAPYHIRNLPPGTTPRAFQDAVRRGDVGAARVGGRALVEVYDWHAYIEARRVRRARPRLRSGAANPNRTAVEPTDDDLLASIGARRTR